MKILFVSVCGLHCKRPFSATAFKNVMMEALMSSESIIIIIIIIDIIHLK